MSHNPVFAIMERADELRSAGANVVSLAAGEPDTPTADHVLAAAVQAVRTPAHHRYGAASGLAGLRTAVAERLSAGTGGTWSSEDLLITLGAKQALFLALNAVLRQPQDTVLVPSPGWPGHRAAVEAAGGRARTVRADGDAGYLVSGEALEAAWVPGTRAVIFANPANPTGAAYDAHHWTDIAAWAAQRDVWVITDDVYGALVYDRDHVHALKAAPQLRDRCVMVDSVSKAYAMTGWRVGWLAGPPDIVDSATRMISRTATHIPQVTQAAAWEALVGGVTTLESTRDVYRKRRDRAHHELAAVDGVDCPLPDGGMFLFPSVERILQHNDRGIRTTAHLAAWLLEHAHVAVVPGEVFEAPGRLRLCFAVNDHALDEALTRLTSAFRDLAPGEPQGPTH